MSHKDRGPSVPSIIEGYDWLFSGVGALFRPLDAGEVSGLPALRWSDGVPIASAESTGAVTLEGGRLGQGFRVRVQADENVTRTVKLWVSARSTRARLEAALNDGSDAAFIGTVDATDGALQNRAFTLSYGPAHPYQMLWLEWTQLEDAPLGVASHVLLQAAALTQ